MGFKGWKVGSAGWSVVVATGVPSTKSVKAKERSWWLVWFFIFSDILSRFYCMGFLPLFCFFLLLFVCAAIHRFMVYLWLCERQCYSSVGQGLFFFGGGVSLF